jgi:urease accessory protein
MTVHAALLVLVDGRLPAGGHAHSGGVEAFVRRGELHDIESLRALLVTRMDTSGFVDATVAAATVRRERSLTELDAEAGARIVSPALRVVSRTLGRQLIRAAQRMWPDARLDAVATIHADGPHHAVALGAAALAAGVDAADAATAAVYGSIATPATAAIRLLGLDPVEVHGLLAALAPRVDIVAAAAAACPDLADAPAPGAPRAELAAEEHAHEEVRLFAS